MDFDVTQCIPSKVHFDICMERLYYTDLVSVWIDFHTRFLYNVSFPVQWVRYEDILFHPVNTTRKYCWHQIGKGKIQVRAEPSKNHSNERTSRTDALYKYSNKSRILAQFTVEQLDYVE